MEQSIWSGMQPVRDWQNVDAQRFRSEIEPLNRPAVFRGLVKHWPAVVKAEESPLALAEYLRRHINAKPVSALIGDPKIRGRFFYRDDLQGFNFSQRDLPLGNLVTILLKDLKNAHASALYAGSVPVPEHAPELLVEHTLDLIDPSIRRQISIWIGNRTRVTELTGISRKTSPA
jgi:hypothetical protein